MTSYSGDFSEFGPNTGYIEELFQLYTKDRALVGEDWCRYFDRMTGYQGPTEVYGNLDNSASSAKRSSVHTNGNGAHHLMGIADRDQEISFIFRTYGHLAAKINPLSRGVTKLPYPPELELEGLTSSEESLVDKYQKLYCGSVGFEFTHLRSSEEKEWLISRIETEAPRNATMERRRASLECLIRAELLETELHKKFVGAKRFSLEGGETTIPVLEQILLTCSERGSKEAILGMAHRGRLNVLVNTTRKPLKKLISEFADTTAYASVGAGDVKYHMGYHSDRKLENGKQLKVSLCYNPSHLEAVNPVVEGIVRALQGLNFNHDRDKVVPILIHGDAAFIGQGVVSETFNLSQVPGYQTGGTIHLVINNQIGFTTTAVEGRSTLYCTDGALGFEVPVFHVNAEDVDAACWVAALAADYRAQFHKDVVIDLYCWRKYGHNEGDDPTFTQPATYAEIKGKKSVPTQYAEKLVSLNIVTQAEVDKLKSEFVSEFEEARTQSSAIESGAGCALHGRLTSYPSSTTSSVEKLEQVAEALTAIPLDFKPHAKVLAMLEKRTKALHTPQGIDWGLAEALAFGTLKMEGVRIRLSGQDAERGTFSHRHIVLVDAEQQQKFCAIKELPGEGAFEVYNSVLSEAAVLGFEYGYSSADPRSLVMWEAQFGDFCNGAQIIIDQFIASSEAKWMERSGVVLLLPHGYEGQGPEHSSARLERFLQLCAEGNLTVAYPSNGAQYFHLLRRQALAEINRPLIVMTPKSLLRLPDAGTSIAEFTETSFQPILVTSRGKPSKTILCSGKIYYELLKAVSNENKLPYRIIRVEQLYPFPEVELKRAFKGLTKNSLIWVQEEPENMGAWSYISKKFHKAFNMSLTYVGRPESASPADGSPKYHAKRQAAIIEQVLSMISEDSE